MERLMTIDEVAEHLRVPVETVRWLRQEGRFAPAVRVGRRQVPVSSKPNRRSGQALVCGWCGRQFLLAARGRPPKWCSQSCRQRAWEQRRAAQSGRAAVDVVVQLVEVEKPIKVVVIERVEVPAVPARQAWAAVLAELVDQLDRGRVYDRDLVELTAAVENVLFALERRPALQRLRRRQTGPRRRW